MRTSHAYVLALLAPAIAAAQVSGPADRQVTDPKSISSPANAAAHTIPIEDLFYTRSVNGGAWSPDGKQVVLTTNLTGRLNLWKLNVSGSWPVQLVQSNERQFSATWSPDGKWIAYQQDSGGNELWDIWAVPADGGAAVNLTNTPERREEEPRWSPDGKSLAMNVKPKDATSYDLAILDWATRQVRQITHETSADRLWQNVAWSPDGKTLYADRAE